MRSCKCECVVLSRPIWVSMCGQGGFDFRRRAPSDQLVWRCRRLGGTGWDLGVAARRRRRGGARWPRDMGEVAAQCVPVAFLPGGDAHEQRRRSSRERVARRWAVQQRRRLWGGVQVSGSDCAGSAGTSKGGCTGSQWASRLGNPRGVSSELSLGEAETVDRRKGR